MRLDSVLSQVLLGSLCLGVLVGTCSAEQSNNNEPASKATTLPFEKTSIDLARIQELESRLVQIIRENDGYISKESFDRKFGVDLRLVQSLGDEGAVYVLGPHSEWYFDVVLTIFTDKAVIGARHSNGSSRLKISFGRDFVGMGGHGCLERSFFPQSFDYSNGWTTSGLTTLYLVIPENCGPRGCGDGKEQYFSKGQAFINLQMANSDRPECVTALEAYREL